MSTLAPPSRAARRLNHVEFVYRPGERPLVLRLFDLLGFATHYGQGDMFVLGAIDPPTYNHTDNMVAGSEVRPEQWAFDQALAEALREEPLATSFAAYQDLLGRMPQWAMHFGILFDSLDKWETAVARVADVEANAPELVGRVRLDGMYRPGEPGAVSEFVAQAFVWTDLIACGSLAFAQRIEISAQARDPRPTLG